MALFRGVGRGGPPSRQSPAAGEREPKPVNLNDASISSSSDQDAVAEICIKLGACLQTQAETHQQALNDWATRLHGYMAQVQVRLDRIMQLQSMGSSTTSIAQATPPVPPLEEELPRPPDQQPPAVPRFLGALNGDLAMQSFDHPSARSRGDRPPPERNTSPSFADSRRTREQLGASRAVTREGLGVPIQSQSSGSYAAGGNGKTWAMNENTVLKFSEDIDTAVTVNTTKLCDGIRKSLYPHERECEEVLLATERVLALVMVNLGIVTAGTGGSEEQLAAGFSLFDLPAPHVAGTLPPVGMPTQRGLAAGDGDAHSLHPADSSQPISDGDAREMRSPRSYHTMETEHRGETDLPGSVAGDGDQGSTMFRLPSTTTGYRKEQLDTQPEHFRDELGEQAGYQDCDRGSDRIRHIEDRLPLIPPASEGSIARRIFLAFEESPKSRLGQILEVFLLLTIAVSTVSFIMESMPEYRHTPEDCLFALNNNLDISSQDCEPVPDDAFSIIEAICIAIFTAEYLVRLLTVHADPHFAVKSRFLPGCVATTWAYMCQPLNVIDFLAVLPFYVDLAMSGQNQGFRLLRLARTLRLFKIGKHHPGFRIFLDVLRMSGQPLAILAFFNMMVAIIFAALIYVAEGQEFSVDPKFTDPATGSLSFPTGVFVRTTQAMDGEEPTPFRSIPYAMWWVFVTMTTVGYGDIAPTSRAGKAIGVMCFYVGIVFLALPISVITLNFEIVYRTVYEPKYSIRPANSKSEKVAIASASTTRRLHSHHRDQLLPATDGFRRSVFILLDDPAASKVGRAVSGLIILTIIVSTCSFVMESMPQFNHTPSECNVHMPTLEDCRPLPDNIFAILEAISIVIFTLDYFLRVITVHTATPDEIGVGSNEPMSPCRITWKYCTQWLNLIDFFAVLPFYVDLVFEVGQSTAVLRVLRLVRVFRVLKAPKLRMCVEMFQTVVADALPALVMLFLLTALMAIFFASCIMFAEGSDYSLDFDKFDRQVYPTGLYVRPTKEGYDIQPSPFRSILYSLWWFFTTATTVGYGDDYPTTTLGRIIGVFSFYMGITLVALKLTAIGASFGKFYPDWVSEVTEHPSDGSASSQPTKALTPRGIKGGAGAYSDQMTQRTQTVPNLNPRSMAGAPPSAEERQHDN
mmetsp:Transcript_41283/g.95022  ORF Transcript_41283/g.95022 Transcript_41283/m.95022 type:complete len:1143 (-) Transcript_41283:203-3631(-)